MKLIKWFFLKLVFPTGSLIELKILVQEPFQGLYSYKTSKLHRKHHKCSGLVQQRDQGKIERRKDEVVNCQISEIYVLSLLRCKVRVPQKTRKALRLYFFFTGRRCLYFTRRRQNDSLYTWISGLLVISLLHLVHRLCSLRVLLLPVFNRQTRIPISFGH